MAIPFQADAEVEWRIENTFKTGQPPLDVTVAPNGQWIFVLSADGSIHIYSSDGKLEWRATLCYQPPKPDRGGNRAGFHPQDQCEGLTI
jgi:hypothetical protein